MMSTTFRKPAARRRDRGSILPMALVATVVIAVVVVAVATYSATTLRYGQVVEARAGRIAAAQGALDDALEQLTIGNPICASAGPVGVITPFPEPVNGTSVVVNCRTAGAELPSPEGWAMVITGVGVPSGVLFQIENSSNQRIGGPIYLEDPNRTTLKNPVLLEGGDLWHPNVACAETDPSDPAVQFRPSGQTVTNLQFEPTRGAYCINKSWSELFGSGPPVSADVAMFEANPGAWDPPPVPDGSCTVFSPGWYTTVPLGENNYFKSGTYVFDNVGTLKLENGNPKKLKVTMGQIAKQGYPTVSNPACNNARLGDATTGATLYVKGNSRWWVTAGDVEISGARQGQGYVSLHDLDSTLGATPIVLVDPGNQKGVVFHGLVWAPRSTVQLGTTPSSNAAGIHGGAVLARFLATSVPASASGFFIEVTATETQGPLILEATADDGTATNTVRAVIDYRPSTNEVAVESRRVLEW